MDAKTLCLAALALHDASGYEIKKLFEQAFSHFQGAGFGSIYPALSKLTEEGLARCREERQDRRPTRKVFSLTKQGQARLIQTLIETEPDERYRSDFLLLVFLGHLLPTPRLAQVLDGQMENLRAEIAHLENLGPDEAPTAGMRFTLRYGIAAKRARLDLIAAERDRLLDEHRNEHNVADAR
ncbi:MAG: PadR family transcriptional regulator [Chromatiales bacterium]|jgi:DNA-binding PadR family transcriptional regulator